MSDFTNEAIQVARRLEEIAELLADGDQGRNTVDSLYMERAELEEKDKYLSAYFAVVNKNLALEQQLKTAKADGVLEFAIVYEFCDPNEWVKHAVDYANNLEGK